ncbi:MAG: Competence protein [candidate division TM6 bacterium GW2011_GWF2_28_16]|nr:MAG: Competence protein [candidate division TM6 bacterium GW2011_GWF2_28_16]
MTTINKYRLLLCLLFLIAGISFQELFNFKLKITLLISLILISSLSLFYKYFKNIKFNKYYYIFILVFFTGSLIYSIQIYKQQKLLNFIKNKNINIIATIENINTKKHARIKQEILIDVKKIFLPDTQEEHKINFKILLYIYTNTDLKYGQKILFKNIYIKETNKNASYKKYLIKEDILTTIFYNNINYKIIKESNNNFKNKIYNIKNNLYKKLKEKIDPKIFNYFSSIFWGSKKEALNPENKNIFNIWGISHYLARSGLHIIIFILIWQLLLAFIPIHIIFKNIFLLLIVLIYVILTDPSISLFRAVYVFAFIQLGNLLTEQTKYIHLLTLTCFFTLLINPIQLFFIDFQLTYGLTFTLILISEFKRT